MKEYKGDWGKKIIIDNDCIIFYEKNIASDKLLFSDIIALAWLEPSLLTGGALLITTKKNQHSINFPGFRRNTFIELRHTLSSGSDIKVETKSFSELIRTPNTSEKGTLHTIFNRYLRDFAIGWLLVVVILFLIVLFLSSCAT